MGNVIKFQAPFERIKFTKTTPDAMLRKAIILQAIIDATNTSLYSKNREIAYEAKEWIFGKDEHFVRMCEEAGVEPDYIIRVTKNAIVHQQTKTIQATASVNYHHLKNSNNLHEIETLRKHG